jgi:hypothetical protein
LLRPLPALERGREAATPFALKCWLGGPWRLDNLTVVALLDCLERLHVALQHGHPELPVGGALAIQIDAESVEQQMRSNSISTGLALMFASRWSFVRSDRLSQETRGLGAPSTLDTACCSFGGTTFRA